MKLSTKVPSPILSSSEKNPVVYLNYGNVENIKLLVLLPPGICDFPRFLSNFETSEKVHVKIQAISLPHLGSHFSCSKVLTGLSKFWVRY